MTRVNKIVIYLKINPVTLLLLHTTGLNVPGLLGSRAEETAVYGRNQSMKTFVMWEISRVQEMDSFTGRQSDCLVTNILSLLSPTKIVNMVIIYFDNFYLIPNRGGFLHNSSLKAILLNACTQMLPLNTFVTFLLTPKLHNIFS